MAGKKTFVAGEILTAADVNSFLMDQAVQVYDDATARDTALPSPLEGQIVYLKDDDVVQKFDGSDFLPVGNPGIGKNVSQAVRTASFSTSSTSFVDWTDVEVTITPSETTSKVLLLLSIPRHSTNTASTRLQTRIVRNTTAVGPSISVQTGTANMDQSASVIFLDSPATSSSITYKAQVVMSFGTGTWMSGTLTAVEVAG